MKSMKIKIVVQGHVEVQDRAVHIEVQAHATRKRIELHKNSCNDSSRLMNIEAPILFAAAGFHPKLGGTDPPSGSYPLLFTTFSIP